MASKRFEGLVDRKTKVSKKVMQALDNYESQHKMRKLKCLFSHPERTTSPSVPKHLKKILSVEGQISPSECLLLFHLASKVSSGCIVEIGSYRGRSTVALALGSLASSGAPVYAIEPHEPFQGVLGGNFGPKDRNEFFKNILRTGVSEIVRLVNLSSEVVSKGWNKEIALLWIDGDHRYEAVKRDFDCWEPFVFQGGLIVFHDSINLTLGPSKVISAAISSKRCKTIRQVDTTTVLEKIS